ncbi:MAG TPA: APC family permease [Candidatus Polarisedimenticolia bacterium]|nr:APC family permease [Candidatus Polarisedimenticolia bacterium]
MKPSAYKPPGEPDHQEEAPRPSGVWRLIVGAPRNVTDPHIFHRLSLVAFLAWVGLGADGLSSSAYGPEEAYKALGEHRHLALFLVLMMAATIAMISIAYSNLIAHFPGGGGGYLVATKLLGNQVGVVSGCALLVDYVLTITVSVASACDQVWSFLPREWASWKILAEFAGLGLLILLNLRGVKESVAVLAPIFLVFVVTHAVAILYAVASHASGVPAVVSGAGSDLRSSLATMGWLPLMLVLLRAYALGGGTYTGIEAVSNGVATLREPRVKTARRTMALMAFSLAFTAGGILLAYLLTDSRPSPGQTMNSVLLSNLFGSWQIAGIAIGPGFVILCLLAEASLLFVAAQTGFLDGPRVLANMALDSWMPHRFAQLSERLVTQNGVVMMGLAAAAALLYTQGDIATLVVMYSINVFITFSLTELGMARHWIRSRTTEPRWKSQLGIHGTGLVMCLSILIVTVVEKFLEGGWVTLVITGLVIALAYGIRSHYGQVRSDLERLDDILVGPRAVEPLPVGEGDVVDKKAPTAIVCVTSFSGFGLHQVLSIHQWFPRYFENFIFASAAVVDTGVFKGTAEVEGLTGETERQLCRYVEWSRAHGLRAGHRLRVGTEAVTTMESLCIELVREYPRAIIFMGKLIFREERWYHRILHNETALAMQRRLQFKGLQTIVLPIRVLEG